MSAEPIVVVLAIVGLVVDTVRLIITEILL